MHGLRVLDSQQHCLPAERETEAVGDIHCVLPSPLHCSQVTRLVLNSTRQEGALALYRGQYSYFTDEYVKHKAVDSYVGHNDEDFTPSPIWPRVQARALAVPSPWNALRLLGRPCTPPWAPSSPPQSGAVLGGGPGGQDGWRAAGGHLVAATGRF